MQIKIFNDDKDIKRYLPIVAYKEYMGHGLWCCGYDEQDELCFILPFAIRKKLIFRYLVALSETIVIKEENDEKDFLNTLMNKLKNEYDFISQSTTNCLFHSFPDNAIYAPFGSYILNLQVDEDNLWKKIHSKHKNVIRRAIREKVEIKEGLEYFDEVYDVIAYTLEKNGMGMEDKDGLKNKILNLQNNFLIIGSYCENKIQSSAIIPYDKSKGYYIYGGSIDKPMLGSHNLLQWEVIKKLKLLGVQEYDFVGARIEPKTEKLKGIQRFKSRFGTSLKEGYLWKYPLNPLKFHLFEFLYKLMRNKKGDVIDQEKNSINF